MNLGLTEDEWQRLHITNGVITTILFVIALVVVPLGFYSDLAFFTGVLGVVGIIISGLLYIASVWIRAIRPVIYVAVIAHSLCPILGVLTAGFVLHVIHSLF
ncbi:MAG: hypothetical protein HZB75_01395 [Candidatus Saccharibacteria bacterium]|nr:MAG: hypothetical protein HZB75_01395 [Candidatus Saccharibacteria bacterium]